MKHPCLSFLKKLRSAPLLLLLAGCLLNSESIKALKAPKLYIDMKEQGSTAILPPASKALIRAPLGQLILLGATSAAKNYAAEFRRFLKDDSIEITAAGISAITGRPFDAGQTIIISCYAVTDTDKSAIISFTLRAH